MKIHLTHKSTNKKTGTIPVSTSSEDTCPTTCPWKGKGCYANGGPLRIHWRKISMGDRGTGYDQFLEEIRSLPIGQLWRHNQAGDLAGSANRINRSMLLRLRAASMGRRGFTYTHKPVIGDTTATLYNRIAIRAANSPEFTINLSADGVEHADKLVALGIAPVTTVLPSDFEGRKFTTPAGNKGIVCPAAYGDISCDKCKLCAIPTRRSIIGFPAHGSQKREIDRRLG